MAHHARIKTINFVRISTKNSFIFDRANPNNASNLGENKDLTR